MLIAVAVAGAPAARAQSPETEKLRNDAHVGAPQTSSHTDCENDSCRQQVCRTDEFNNSVCNYKSYPVQPPPMQLPNGLPDVTSLPHRLYRSADRQLDRIARSESLLCSIVADPTTFDHQTVTLQGTAAALKETTSRRGNDYTTFKLQDPSGCGALDIFTWGHPAMSNGDHVRVEGVFETEHNEGGYTFYNEVVATKVSRDDLSAAPTPDANTPAAIPGGVTPTTNARESDPFNGRWSATVGPQGGCNFTSILILDVVGSSIVGNATNPLGVFPLSGTVNPNGEGVFKIGRFSGTIRFSGTKFEANYANDCGGRFATGSKRTAGNLD